MSHEIFGLRGGQIYREGWQHGPPEDDAGEVFGRIVLVPTGS